MHGLLLYFAIAKIASENDHKLKYFNIEWRNIAYAKLKLPKCSTITIPLGGGVVESEDGWWNKPHSKHCSRKIVSFVATVFISKINFLSRVLICWIVSPFILKYDYSQAFQSRGKKWASLRNAWMILKWSRCYPMREREIVCFVITIKRCRNTILFWLF